MHKLRQKHRIFMAYGYSLYVLKHAQILEISAQFPPKHTALSWCYNNPLTQLDNLPITIKTLHFDITTLTHHPKNFTINKYIYGIHTYNLQYILS